MAEQRSEHTMAVDTKNEEQSQNTAKLVMTAFYKVLEQHDSVTAEDITRFLQDKFGDVWQANVLTDMAEQTLARSVVLGFLYRQGDNFVANVAREMGGRRRRRCCCCRPKRRKRKRKCCARKRSRRKCKCPPRPRC